MVVPHVVDPSDLPPGYVEVSRYTQVKSLSFDPNGWNFITDAMGRVLLPEGTAQSAHIPGIDIAGKTGSAQVVSLALRAKHENSEEFAQNGWFVGFTPRRNPDIVVCVLFQGGEHGKLAARLATQVIKAYVDKQRRQPTKLARAGAPQKVDVGGLWSDPTESSEGKDSLHAAHFYVDIPAKPMPLATAAPGVD